MSGNYLYNGDNYRPFQSFTANVYLLHGLWLECGLGLGGWCGLFFVLKSLFRVTKQVSKDSKEALKFLKESSTQETEASTSQKRPAAGH